MTGDDRALLIASVAASIVTLPGPARVAVDGVDGVGKTFFADELAEAISRLGRPVIRASADGFHQPEALRHRRGRTSPEGFFHDSYDYAALSACLLDPLGPGGGGTYRRAVFDHTTDRMVEAEAQQAPPGAVLVLDGIFLHRDELVRYWDYSVFLTAGFATTFARLAARDGGDPDPGADSNRRYLEGQRLYLAACRPQQRASIVIDNTDLRAPRVIGRDPTDRHPARSGDPDADATAARGDSGAAREDIRRAFEGGHHD